MCSSEASKAWLDLSLNFYDFWLQEVNYKKHKVLILVKTIQGHRREKESG